MSITHYALPPLFRIDSILDACQKDSLILTANQRLSSKAIQSWGHYQQEKNKESWSPPRIFAIDTWFKECWKKLQALAYKESFYKIISAEQERIFWEDISSKHRLMQTEVLAQQAASAYKALKKWELTNDELNHYESDISVGLLQHWFTLFEKKLASAQLITYEESLTVIGQAYKNNTLQTETEVSLIGFDDIPPLLQTQLNNMSETISNIETDNFTPTHLSRREYNDFDAETQAASLWAKAILFNHKETNPPRIGIILPNLGQCRAQIERTLIDTFEGHSLLAKTPRYTLPFNISAGIPLGKTPLFVDTFLLLKLNRRSQNVDDIYRLLFSPFWGNYSSELELRSRLVNDLQSLGLLRITTQELCWRIKHRTQSSPQERIDFIPDNTPSFKYLESISHKEKYQHHKQLPSQWINIFLKQLKDINWPGERQPDSMEYQQTQLWHQLLESFASLDSVLENITVDDAIAQLQSMANHQPFQAKVPDSPIQVLGILEGSGLHFSHCWILGLHQQSWPPAPLPNPMLPISLQRKYNMPHSSSLRELQFAQSLTQSYKHCATEIIFSSASYEPSSETELSPSQLIQDIPITNIHKEKNNGEYNNIATNFFSYLKKQQQIKMYETVSCQYAPAVSIFDISSEGILTGGSSIIKSQSINAFDAFIKHRLKITTTTQATIGFSALDKGNILHLSLASLWQKLKTQETLLSIDNDELKKLLTNIVNIELNNVIKHKRYHFGKELCQLEAQRQISLILKWLAYEKARQPFSVISIEENHTVDIHGYSLQLRLDRIDEIKDVTGKYQRLIIDYKTGQCSPNDWKGERPNDPQLPFYLTINCHLNDVNAIAFAQVNIKNQSLIGLHHEDSHIKEITSIEKNRAGLHPNWEQTTKEWSRISKQLFEQFLFGEVTIDYSNNKQLNFNQELICLNRFYDL